MLKNYTPRSDTGVKPWKHKAQAQIPKLFIRQNNISKITSSCTIAVHIPPFRSRRCNVYCNALVKRANERRFHSCHVLEKRVFSSIEIFYYDRISFPLTRFCYQYVGRWKIVAHSTYKSGRVYAKRMKKYLAISEIYSRMNILKINIWSSTRIIEQGFFLNIFLYTMKGRKA